MESYPDIKAVAGSISVIGIDSVYMEAYDRLPLEKSPSKPGLFQDAAQLS
ncbi:MAG: hypothetical protein U5K27_02855 [Desulfotignum sp.]|nr:hypothetical protein [Desulfotignum sp.]